MANEGAEDMNQGDPIIRLGEYAVPVPDAQTASDEMVMDFTALMGLHMYGTLSRKHAFTDLESRAATIYMTRWYPTTQIERWDDVAGPEGG